MWGWHYQRLPHVCDATRDAGGAPELRGTESAAGGKQWLGKLESGSFEELDSFLVREFVSYC